MELAIQKLAALNLLVMGLSHIFQHRVWAEFFIHWREKGEVGISYNAILHFAFGTLIVAEAGASFLEPPMRRDFARIYPARSIDGRLRGLAGVSHL